VRVPPLKEFEVTQIANLGPLEAEEAKALIPRSVLLVHFSVLLAG
jgi:hypothetical protein